MAGEARLSEDFFERPCVGLAKALLGQVLARRLPDGRELRGRIVETEAYLGGEDAASHSHGGRRTARNAAMFMRPGTLYVYQIYGLYCCLNVSSQGEGAAVLLRALEPLEGLEAMRRLRQEGRHGPARPPRDWQLCNGPAKLCRALAVDRAFDRQHLARAPALWLEPPRRRTRPAAAAAGGDRPQRPRGHPRPLGPPAAPLLPAGQQVRQRGRQGSPARPPRRRRRRRRGAAHLTAAPLAPSKDSLGRAGARVWGTNKGPSFFPTPPSSTDSCWCLGVAEEPPDLTHRCLARKEEGGGALGPASSSSHLGVVLTPHPSLGNKSPIW